MKAGKQMKQTGKKKPVLKIASIVFFLICVTLLLPVMAAERVPTGAQEKIEFVSENYTNLPDMLKGRPTSLVTITATLSFPDGPKEKYPAIVLMHGIAGSSESCEGWYTGAFSREGFAVLTMESARLRGVRDAAITGDWKLFGPMVADAYHALNILAQHPRIDAQRIAIAGVSTGGDIAHITAFEPLRASRVRGSLRFAAHLAFYPTLTWGIEAGSNSYTKSPLLIMVGDKDDCGPPSKLQSYLDYAKQAGFPASVETIIYPEAYNGWGNSWYTPTSYKANLSSTAKCPFALLAPQSSNGLTLLGPRGIIPFSLERWNACMAAAKGYHIGFDENTRNRSFTDAISFLQKAMR
ncbi:MAG TPA: acetylxylan esterase [Syntrophorhabdaceae bacterium]|nr:acetylxylan esterase [Syntrophorhabdaceae bacterium]HQM82746.1 acetylxylan esterase [Syntrophorhabdaceae bacterium]